ncbi:doublesex and mab-3 related transcription factor 3-like protein [Leptotrombidium deliense]|uniref:Doublesex and mab-3 related transcription factor 3-like protein n=1 Tax=Leptotrombidium deliense TaxID=299467 RepID=A0A443S5S7_9ACAR|nr:doublesex and mab-3 related transcription factor 3-like protein [Leptotrombidium deliense]
MENKQTCGKVIIVNNRKRVADRSQSFTQVKKEQIQTEPKSREVHCSKCRGHGKLELKKNHKGHCDYDNCPCPKCKLMDERRVVLKLQVRQQREFRKEMSRPAIPISVIQDSSSAQMIPNTPNVVVTNEVSHGQSWLLSFHESMQSDKALRNYLAAAVQISGDVYRIAMLDLFRNNPMAVFQHLMRTNAKIDMWRKMSLISQNCHPYSSQTPTTVAAPHFFTSYPNSSRTTLLTENRSEPYMPNVTTFRTRMEDLAYPFGRNTFNDRNSEIENNKNEETVDE